MRSGIPLGTSPLFQVGEPDGAYVKYLNNSIEQDHRYTRLRVITSQNFCNFGSAKRTISGYESMNMIRKGQIKNVKQDDVLRC